MAATAKYLFDEDFAAREKPTITLVEAERRRADAESQAYRNGFAAAQTAAMARIAEGLDRLNQTLGQIEAQFESEAVEVAVAVAAKLAPALVAREPFAEISALATDTFKHLVKTPHVVVRLGSEAFEDAKAKLEEIADAHGFEGRLVVTADPAVPAGDCRIEWAEGGVGRDRAATLAVIDDVVARYVSARTSAAN
jgi:flagellar assembly protein FliH